MFEITDKIVASQTALGDQRLSFWSPDSLGLLRNGRPFHWLVRPDLLLDRILTVVRIQLGQAILTEPAEHTHDTIRLSDTRTPQRSSIDQEREGFLARSQDGDWEHENPKAGGPLETRRQPSPDAEDDDYEFVPGSSDSTSRSSSSGGSLSAKAGIILVRLFLPV